MRVTVVLPTYNESENLRFMVTELLALQIPDVELSLLVVDSDSPDGTGAQAEALCRRHAGRMLVLHLGVRRGLGTAYRAGFARALEDGAERIVQMDCDFSHPPASVPDLVRASGEADMVLGSRYTAGGRVKDDWPWWRWLLSWFANSFYVRVTLGLPLADATGGFRCWRRETLLGMDVASRVKSEGYVFQVEMAYLAWKLGYEVVEVPIEFAERRAGTSKMNLAIQLEASWRVFDVRRRLRRLGPGDRAPSLPVGGILGEGAPARGRDHSRALAQHRASDAGVRIRAKPTRTAEEPSEAAR